MIATQNPVSITHADHHDRETAFSFLPLGHGDHTPSQNNEQQQQHLDWDLPGTMSREQSGIAALQALPGLMSRECSGFAPMIMSREASFGAMCMSREHSFGTMTREHSGFGGIGGNADDNAEQNEKSEAPAEPSTEEKSAAATVSHSSEEDVSTPPSRGGMGIADLVNAVTASLADNNKRKVDDDDDEGEGSESGKRSVSPRSSKKAKRAAVAAAVAGAEQPNSSRGAHVRERPEMQRNARDGQKHWGTQVKEMRQLWADKDMSKHTHFEQQINMCTRLHIKSQHECLLRQLQMAAVEKIIIPSKFLDDEKESFLGWTGFEVAEDHGAEFRKRIEALFASTPSDKTLNNTFRRAGLVPDHSWAEAWNGIGGFVYDREKRAQYGGQ